MRLMAAVFAPTSACDASATSISSTLASITSLIGTAASVTLPSPFSAVLSNADLCVKGRIVRHAIVTAISSGAQYRTVESQAMAAFAFAFVAVDDNARIVSSVVIWINNAMLTILRIVGIAIATPAAKGAELFLRPPGAVIAVRNTTNTGGSATNSSCQVSANCGVCTHRRICA